MKTTAILLSMLFYTAAVSAQTTVSNHESIQGKTEVKSQKTGNSLNGTAHVSSSTSVHSSAMKQANSRASMGLKDANQAAVNSKNSIKAGANEATRQSEKNASGGSSVEANSNTGLSARASDGMVKSSGNARIKGGSYVSTKGLAENAGKIESGTKAGVKAGYKAGANTAQKVTTHVRNTTRGSRNVKVAESSSIKSAGSVHMAHPKPISIRTGSIVKTGGVIKL